MLARKLNEELIRYITLSPKTANQLATELGVSYKLISGVRAGDRWYNVPRPEVPEEVRRQRRLEGARLMRAAVCSLSEDQVRDIKKKLLTDRRRGVLARIAREYGVPSYIIYDIGRERTWSHIKVEGFEELKKVNQNLKLTEDQVREILISTKTGAELSREFSVNEGLISRIRSGKIWRHVSRSEVSEDIFQQRKERARQAMARA